MKNSVNTISRLIVCIFLLIAASAEEPSIISPTATNITSTTATLGANVTSNGGLVLNRTGIVISPTADNPDPFIEGDSTRPIDAEPTATGIFTVPATGLTPCTQYSYRGYAANPQGIVYTSVRTFTTECVVPVTTGRTFTGLIYDSTGKVRGSYLSRLGPTNYGTLIIWVDGKRGGSKVLGSTQAIVLLDGRPVNVDFPLGPLNDFGNQTRNVTISTGSEVVTGVAVRSPYDSRLRTLDAGKYTFAAANGTNVAALMTGTLTSFGGFRGTVIAGNGERATFASQEQSDGKIVVYCGIANNGVQTLSGVLTIVPGPAPQVTSSLTWLVPPGVDFRFPAGVDAEYETVGARFIPGSPGNMLALNRAKQILLTITHPGAAETNYTIALGQQSTRFVTTFPYSSLQLFTGTGAFTGIVSTERIYRPFYGVFLQGPTLNYGIGFMLDPRGIGQVSITPREIR